jgi:hypothetical protein
LEKLSSRLCHYFEISHLSVPLPLLTVVSYPVTKVVSIFEI